MDWDAASGTSAGRMFLVRFCLVQSWLKNVDACQILDRSCTILNFELLSTLLHALLLTSEAALSRCFSIVPQTELVMRGSNGLAKGPRKVAAALVAHFDQKKPILGDTCSHLV